MTDSIAITIRDAGLDDVPAIAGLAAEFAEYLRALGDTSEFRLTADAIARDGFGSAPAFKGIVAQEAGRVVGYLLHHDAYDTDAACRLLTIVDLFVATSARGHGVGAALMQAAAEIARAHGARQLVWTVYRENTLALEFYERIGGRRVPKLHLMCLDV